MNNNTTYKDSPLGKIPSDWDVKPFGEVFEYLVSPSFSRENLTIESTKNEIYYIHYGDIHATYNSEILDFELEKRVPFLKDEFYRENFNYLKDGDLVIADASEDYQGIGNSIEIRNIGEKRVIGGLHTLVVRDNSTLTINGFRTYIFKNPKVHNEIKKIATGISVYGISKSNLSNLKIPLPPLPEQTRIAEVLDVWDIAISNLQATIEQVELRNKWLMQELLTGKKRLKGFSGEWKKVGAGEIFKSITIKGFENEELLSATQDRGIIPRTMLEGRVTMPEGSTTGYKLVEPGDFVISLRSFQGGLEYSYYRGIVSPAYVVLKPKNVINDEFYKQYYKSYEFIGRLATAVIGIRDGKQISYDDFCVVKIPYPTFEEQTAIGHLLQVADKEVQVQRCNLDKIREQKKGLMQILLTGKKRLKI